MKMNRDAEPLYTTEDFWYSLFEGGYIDPSDYITDEHDLANVLDATSILLDFKQSMEAAGLIEEC